MEIDIASEQLAQGFTVHVAVRLSSRETNRLFVNGDVLVQLPSEGLVSALDEGPLSRPSIFLSELAGSMHGFTRTFTSADAADRFAGAVGDQLTSLQAIL
ncbi:MAG: hypothetical protein ACLQUT_11965 [Thermoleophilia bacterium]